MSVRMVVPIEKLFIENQFNEIQLIRASVISDINI